jgi:hypothetical protein
MFMFSFRAEKLTNSSQRLLIWSKYVVARSLPAEKKGSDFSLQQSSSSGSQCISASRVDDDEHIK